MNGLWFDGLHIYRRSRRDARFVLAVIFCFGLASGLSTATFSVISTVVLRPFPYREPDQLALVWGSRSWHLRPAIQQDHLQDWISHSRVLDGGAFFQLNPLSLALDTGEVVTGGIVDSSVFSVLGRSPLLGRPFPPGYGQSEEGEPVILSYAFWNSRFGADQGALGRSLRLDGRPHTVIGVMPPGFFFPDQQVQLWVPLRDPTTPVHAVFRLKRGGTLAEVQAELDGWLRTPSPGADGPGAYALHSMVLREYGLALGTLLAAVVLILLIGCANAANLLLGRGLVRSRELAVCAALGAGPGRLFRFLMLESLLLAVAGGAVGLGCGWGALRALRGLALTDVPRLEASRIDGPVLAFAITTSLLSGVLAGVWPAWKATRLDLLPSLQTAPGGTPGRRQAQGRDLLVAAAAALALVMLVATGLLINSFVRRIRADWGFEPEDLLAVEVTLPETGEQLRAHWATLAEELSGRRSGVSGITDVAVAFGIPLKYRYRQVPIALEGKGVAVGPWVRCWTVGSGYFRTMGIPLRRGRDFDEHDRWGGERVLVVSRELAARLWPGEDSIGRHLQLLQLRKDIRERLRDEGTPFLDRAIVDSPDSWEAAGPPWRVIGEVGGVRAFGLDLDPDMAIYLDFRQDPRQPPSRGFLVARTSLEALPAATLLKDEISAALGKDSVRGVSAMSTLVSASIGGRGSNKLVLVVSTLLGGVALFLALVGVYSVVSLAVNQQAREIGIRRALGAKAGSIVLRVLKQGMRPVLFGAGFGLASAFFLTRWLSGLLFQVKPMDPATLGTVLIVLLLSAGAACLPPALRVLARSPAEALRLE